KARFNFEGNRMPQYDLSLLKGLSFFSVDPIRHLGVAMNDHPPSLMAQSFFFKGSKDLMGYGGFLLNVAATLTIGAWLTECGNKAWAVAFSRHFDKPQIGHWRHHSPRPILSQFFFENVKNLFSMRFFFHVDEVHDDDPAAIADAELVRNFGGIVIMDLDRKSTRLNSSH